MLPVVAIIGRPNVGKSTLFNCLTNSKKALVFNLAGTTRDRNYSQAKVNDLDYILTDTAGTDLGTHKEQPTILLQTKIAIEEANLILLVMDASSGLTANDLNLAKNLRKFGKKIILVINKIDGVNVELIKNDFFSLGLSEIVLIAAKTNRGINQLKDLLCQHLLSFTENKDQIIGSEPNNKNLIKLAIIGQPNVGKSTLINTILGENRVVVMDHPGTTRDSIYIKKTIGKMEYLLIDTAGIRRRSRVNDPLEKFSVIKTLQSINDAAVVLLLIDSNKGVVEQDFKLINAVVNAGRSIIILFNKWDLIEPSQQQKIFKNFKIKLDFIDFIEPVKISALSGSGVNKIFKLVLNAYRSATLDVATNKLSLLLAEAIAEHQPPLSKGRRIKLRYAHLGGHLPFTIVIHGTQVENLSSHYKKYLSNFYRSKLNLYGTVVNIVCKNSDNPYVD